MDDIKIVFKFIRNIAKTLLWEGLLILVVGALIFIYPELLGMLVGVFLIITGIVCLVLAAKVNSYSKIKIEL